MPRYHVMQPARMKSLNSRDIHRLKSITSTKIAEGPLDDQSQWAYYVDEIPVGSKVTFHVKGLGTADCANWDAAGAEGRVGDEIAPDGFEVEDVECTGGFLSGGDGLCHTRYVGTGEAQAMFVGVGTVVLVCIAVAVLFGSIAALYGVITGQLGEWLGQFGDIAKWVAIGAVAIAGTYIAVKLFSGGGRAPPRYYPYYRY